MNVKQVLVIRKDLKMRRGKEIAQCCHASLAIFFNRMEEHYFNHSDGGNDYAMWVCEMTPEMEYWKTHSFVKVCLVVHSEEELLEIVNSAKLENLPVSLITDNGTTEFHGVATNTCCAIGPDLSEKIDKITGHLSLY